MVGSSATAVPVPNTETSANIMSIAFVGIGWLLFTK
jgi:hypothetical protein